MPKKTKSMSITELATKWQLSETMHPFWVKRLSALQQLTPPQSMKLIEVLGEAVSCVGDGAPWTGAPCSNEMGAGHGWITAVDY